ncbi:MAG: peptidylprolyl isomerase [Candidatus Hydrogenedentes bacterium]|nr:peptidylprolyl isomerase [Candidatus Hydrogenedentota bacterium]
MTKLLQCLSAGIMLFTPFLVIAQELTDEQATQVIARVGDEEITAGQFARDLQFRLGQIKSATGKDIKPDLRMRRALMNELIDNRILSIAARNAGTVVTDEELEAEFASRKSLLDSEEAYQGYLDALKITEAELRDNVRSRLRVKAFVDKKTGDLSASEEKIREYYELLKSQGKMTRTTDTRDIAVILLRAKGGSDADWLAAEERAKAVKKRLDTGDQSFEAVAKEVSEDPNTAPGGGLLQEMKLGSFYPELERAMDELDVGEVSKPIRSVMGWYVITVLKENKPGTIPLEKVSKRLEKQIIDQKRKVAIAEIVAGAQKIIRVEMVELAPMPNVPAATQEQ